MTALRLLASAVLASATATAAAVDAAGQGPGAPYRMRVEYMREPQGVDVHYPLRFSWALAHTAPGQAQTAYQIQVVEVSTGGSAWDSAKTTSNVSQNVPLGTTEPHGAIALKPATAYSWRVKYWDSAAAESGWSLNASFSTGLYSTADWKGAQWIGTGDMAQLRTEFSLAKPVRRATAFIVGLGYYKLFVDGSKVSDHELGAFTTYSERVYYDTWDCTAAINAQVARPGRKQPLMHAVGVSLGDGWYAQKTVHVGKPELLFRLAVEFTDGSTQDVVSTPKWTANRGPIESADIYAGETYNAAKETPGWTEPSFEPSLGGGSSGADQGWVAAAVQPPPSAHVKITSHAILPPIRVAEDYTPCNMWQSAPGEYVFDFCQNMAGFTTLTIPDGIAVNGGVNISQLAAEAIHGPPPAKVNHHYRKAAETNVYITKAGGAAVSYTTQFVYAGFRYVQLTGYPGVPDFHTLTAHFVHTDYESTGSISFSDPMLDAVQHITRTAAMSNFQSIPTDCPQRERRGWLGDAQLSAETNMHNWDMGAPYTSFVQQIADSQNNVTGDTQDCVPYYGHGREPADPAWGAAYTFLADWVGKYYHDNQIFAEHYAGITAHMEQLVRTAASNAMDGLLTYSGWSDWCPPEGCKACWAKAPGSNDPKNSALVSSFYYISELRVVARYAGLLGKAKDQARYSKLAAAAAVAFNKNFFNAANATYSEQGRACGEYLSPQTTISLAYELGVIPAEHLSAVIDTLVADVAAHDWHLDVGIVGIKYLLPTLSDAGRGDVALMIAQARTPPSYIYMVEQGATTLWETWTGSTYEPVASWNHIMFGSNSEWYFKYLAGITMAPSARGWQELSFQPQVWNDQRGVSICANLSSTSASVVTPRGEISAAWQCAHGTANGLCAVAREQATLALGCAKLGGGLIEHISFASYGVPTGACGDAAGFKRNGTCDLQGVTAKLQKLCVGKPSCSVMVTSQILGGDPCFKVVKYLAVQATGCNSVPKEAVFSYAVTVPVGSRATVVLPMFGAPAAAVEVAEGPPEARTSVFSKGKFVAGVGGVTGAAVVGTNVNVKVGSGTFNFAVLA